MAQTYSPMIYTTPNAIATINGAWIKLCGEGFPTNSNGMVVSVDGTVITDFTSDKNGNVELKLLYAGSNGFVQAIRNSSVRNFINIHVFDNTIQQWSNVVSIYF